MQKNKDSRGKPSGDKSKSKSNVLDDIPKNIKTLRNEKKFLAELSDKIPETEWEEMPDLEVPIIALEVCSLQGLGKTHLAGTFPKPALFDTEGKGYIVWKKLGHEHLVRGETFEDVVAFVNAVVNNPEIETAVFDCSKDVDEMAEIFTCEQLGRDMLYSQGGAVMYSHKNDKMDWIVQTLRNAGKNIVFTSRMKDEYKKNTRTGKLVRDGYKKAPYQFDIVIELTETLKWNDDIWILDEVIGSVLKNGFIRRGRHFKPYLPNVSYDTIIAELVNPKRAGETKEMYMKRVFKQLHIEE